MIWLLRLSALVAAFVLLRDLLRWFWRALISSASHTQTPPVRQGVVKRDPICGTYVDVEVSVQARQGGEVLHFCSAQCRDAYLTQQSAPSSAGPAVQKTP